MIWKNFWRWPVNIVYCIIGKQWPRLNMIFLSFTLSMCTCIHIYDGYTYTNMLTYTQIHAHIHKHLYTICTKAVSHIKKYTIDNFNKKLIFFWSKDTGILLFLVESYKIKMDIIKYYLSPNPTALTLCNQKQKIPL